MMADPNTRRWTDRNGTTWRILYNPSVELDTRRDRVIREGLLFRSDSETLRAPAPYGDDLEALTDEDLQGLLDQARQSRSEGSAWR